LESQSQTLSLELESLQADVAAANEAVHAAEKALDEAIIIEHDLQIKVGLTKAKYDEAKAATETVEEKMAEVSSILKQLGKEKLSLTKKAEHSQLEAKKMSIQVSKYKKETGSAEKVIAALSSEFEWIEECKNEFGIKGGDYDFSMHDVDEMSKELKDLQSKQASLSKKINKKVMGMIEKAEAEYSELLRKRRVIENDKKKIQSVIEELDIKKKSELERT
jgi:structural maintenance of chromosome 2